MNAVIRWNPIREMAAMQSAMDRLFEEAWRGVQPNRPHEGAWLAVDVHETEQEYTVLTALPGLQPDAINISYHNGTLTISGELQEPAPPEGTNVLLRENFYGKFSREINLPAEVDANAISAAYENGRLILTLPKAPSAKPIQIAVKNKS